MSYTSVVTEKCDVYSFGVVVLEVLMGKHPGDLLQSHREDHMLVKEVLDQRPLTRTKTEEEGVMLLMKVAFACLRASPQARPTMKEVHQRLNTSGSSNSFDAPFDTLTLGQLRDA